MHTNIPSQDPPEDVCMATTHSTIWCTPQVRVRFRRFCASSGIIMHLASRVHRHIIYQPKLRFTFKPLAKTDICNDQCQEQPMQLICFRLSVFISPSLHSLSQPGLKSLGNMRPCASFSTRESWKHDSLHSYLVHSQGVH